MSFDTADFRRRARAYPNQSRSEALRIHRRVSTGTGRCVVGLRSLCL